MAEPIFCTVVEQKPAFTFKLTPQREVFQNPGNLSG